jgi:hypothetical protein
MSFIQSGNAIKGQPQGIAPTWGLRRAKLPTRLSIVCQIKILVGVQALAWFCQTKVWTPFSEKLYLSNHVLLYRIIKLNQFP